VENRSNVSTFIVHSGIPKAYNRWYSQYKSTRVKDFIIYILIIYYIYTVEYLKVKKIKVIQINYILYLYIYIHNKVSDTCTFILTVPPIVSFWDPRMHYKS
jgi:hypothetical protein